MRNLLILAVVAGAVYHFFLSGPDTLDALSFESASAGGIQVIENAGGADFAVDALSEHGQITVVEFYTETCGACRKLRGHYKKFLVLRPDVLVKRVKMPDRWSVAWAKRNFHLDIGATPFVHIYDSEGKLIAADKGRGGDGRETLYEWMNAEMRKDWERRQQG